MSDLLLNQGRPSEEQETLFNVVLIEPEIPQNTGNVGRTCVGTRSRLHLVGEMGFAITDRNLKRAGLDYWPHLWWQRYQSIADWQSHVPDLGRVFYFSTKAERTLYDVNFKTGDWLVFGKETKGLDPELLRRNSAQSVTIPQLGPVRSLNVATAVAIALYEGLRQNRLGRL